MNQHVSPLVGLVAGVFVWLLAATPSPAQPIHPTDCVGVWRFDEGSGTTALDSWGHLTYGSVFTTGRVCGAFSVDGQVTLAMPEDAANSLTLIDLACMSRTERTLLA